MQDGARLFAYTTWALMISLGIVVFTHQFFRFMDESLTIALFILLGFGFLYFNLAFAAIKRYIKKVPAPTNNHFILGVTIFLPPFFWLIVTSDAYTQNELLILLVLLISVAGGTHYGNISGIKARFEYVQKIKEYQKRAEELERKKKSSN